MVTSPELHELAAALSKAQGAMDGAKKSSSNPFFKSKYADLASVKDAIREPFATHGLSVVQVPQTTFQGAPEAYEWTAKHSGEVRHGVRVFTVVTVLTRLLHTSGQFIEESVSAMLPNGDPQSVGSAISYLRRYALQSVAGIAAEDDDAESVLSPSRRPTLPAAPAKMATAVQHPSGYLKWLDALRQTAMEGTPALERGWYDAPKEFRQHLTSTNVRLRDELKAIAARQVARAS